MTRAGVVTLVSFATAACSAARAPEERVATHKAAIVVGEMGRAMSVAAGDWHSCAVVSGGGIVCWGAGGWGQLGNGVFADSAVPVAVSGITGAVAVAAGGLHTCALLGTGRVSCWGNAERGQLGNGSTAASALPVPVSDLLDATAITAGDSHTCALRANAEVVCWGEGSSGELGNGDSVGSAAPVPVASLADATAVAAGPGYSCALRASDWIACWGDGPSSVGSVVPANVAWISGAVAVTVGEAHVCALTDSGGVLCFGRGSSGQLGNGGFADAASPVTVSGVSDAVAVAAHANHTCAARATGAVACWGGGESGQLGSGSFADTAVPVEVSGIVDARAVAAGRQHACALRATAEVSCWGPSGQLGDGRSLPALVPVAVAGLSGAIDVAAGAIHTCALRSTGEVACWGSGPLQLGSDVSFSAAPVTVSGLSGVQGIARGWNHTCAHRSSGDVVCWGVGRDGQLGDGASDNASAPVIVAGLTGVSVFDRWGAAGIEHTCAVHAAGDVVCWGSGENGRLGNGSFADSATPVPVSGIDRIRMVAAGFQHGCAVDFRGWVKCWGHSGAVGNDAVVADVPGPIGVSHLWDGALSTVDLAAGAYHTCAVVTTGEVLCWGSEFGHEPVTVVGLADARIVAAGLSHTCAIRATGEIACWGRGAEGQLGNGGTADSDVPVPVTGVANAVAIGAGQSHTCAVLATGDVVCWGRSVEGQLGNDTLGPSTAPVAVSGLGAKLGDTCSSAAECPSGFCVDGVCCDGACGGSDPNDCQACAVAFGGTADGACTPRAPTVCADDGSLCSLDVCNGTSLVCEHPPLPASTCTAATDDPTTCSSLPMPTYPTCVNLPGGPADAGGVSLGFDPSWSGEVKLVASNTGCPPPTGFQVLGSTQTSGTGHYWNIDANPPITSASGIQIEICFHYDDSWVTGSESAIRVVHGESANCGGGWTMLSLSRPPDTVNNIVCVYATSLSPFALVEPADETPPVFSNVPGTIVAYATSVSGAVVDFASPAATDETRAPLPVSCAPASGAKFPPGKTTVTCSATDAAGNAGTATFTVWVQYQAPTDGTFFLKPIRPDGSSRFRIGRAVPVKFKLTGASAGIADLVARLTVTRISDEVRGSADCDSDEEGEDTDMLFKYRKGKDIYAYRWKTRGETQGTYRLRADLGDGVAHDVNVSLRAAR